jgi:regulator of protease activity HflC (stomatin/prohibitin superfamily)
MALPGRRPQRILLLSPPRVPTVLNTAPGWARAEGRPVRQLRRIIGYADLAQLVPAIERDLDQQTAPTPTEEHVTLVTDRPSHRDGRREVRRRADVVSYAARRPRLLLAQTAALPRSAFFERFTRTVGLPPMEYLLAWRMALAKDLLRRQEFGTYRPRRTRAARCAGGDTPKCPPSADDKYLAEDEHLDMIIVYILVALALAALAGVALAVRILKQYERAVLFRLGRVRGGARGPGVIVFVPFVDRVHRVSLRIVTMPIQSQGIITRDNVSVDVSAVAYYRVADPIRSVVAIENVSAAIDQIAQTTLRAVVGRHTLDETLSETETINRNIREILDVQTEEWGIKVTVVELKDIQLPEGMKRAMARQAEAEREKRAKIIAAEGEALAAGELAHASDTMLAHPLALQLRNLQTLVEIAVDKNSTVVFPAPLMSTIQELGAFMARESAAAGDQPVAPSLPSPVNGATESGPAPA